MGDNKPVDTTPDAEDPPPQPEPEASPPAGKAGAGEQPPPKPEDEPNQPTATGPDDLGNETDASNLDWGRDSDQRRQALEDGLRGLGVDPDALIRMVQSGTPSRNGGTSYSAMGTMSMAAGKIINNMAPSAVERVRGELLRPDWVKPIVDAAVPVRPFGDMIEVARKYNVLYQSGPDGSGRRTIAYAVLERLVGCDKIITVDLDPGADLAAVLDHPKVLQPGHGSCHRARPDAVGSAAAVVDHSERHDG